MKNRNHAAGRVRLGAALALCASAWMTAAAEEPLRSFPVETETAPLKAAFRVAKVVALDDSDRVYNNAVVLVRDGKIEAVGAAADVKIPDGYRVIDFPDAWLAPGFVEGHNHAAAASFADLNDMVYQSNPGLDTRSIAQPDAYWSQRSRMGGVTTAIMIPGSGTNISGMGTLVSTGGNTPDEMIMRSPGSLKIAQAGNPEWYFGGNGRSFMNWNTRQTLAKARDYNSAWEAFERGESAERPAFDPQWEIFRGIIRREIPVTVHTQIYQVVLATIRMVKQEFNLWTVTDHSTFDAFKLGPVVRNLDMWVICGPRVLHADFTARRLIGIAASWWKNGVRRIGINTDSPVIAQEELSVQAAMNCWLGFLPYQALRALTHAPAKALKIYDRVGSIEAAKQADFAIWTGDPIDPRSACLMTIINGRIAYDGTRGVRRF